MSALQRVFFHSTARGLHREALLRRMLQTGEVHPSLHYLSGRQASLWMRVHTVHAPLFQDHAFVGIFERVAEKLGAMGVFGGVVALGPGGGEKEVLMLEAVAQSGVGVAFVAIDASAELALMSVERAARVGGVRTMAVVGDLGELGGILEAVGVSDGRGARVFTAFGITPNLLPEGLLSSIRLGMRDGDVLAISANLAREGADEVAPGMRDVREVVLAQYDNEATRQWLRRLLVEEGLEGDYGDVRFEVGQVRGNCAVIADACLVSGREGLPERLKLFFSLRFTARTFPEVLRRHGFNVLAAEVTPCGYEGVWLCSRAD
ncbi:MAG: hypothetical protein RIS92_985 [Verrucomicrobiota bacterium]